MKRTENQSPAFDVCDPGLSFRRLEVRDGKTVAVFRPNGSVPEFRIHASPDPWNEAFSPIGEIALGEPDLERRRNNLRQRPH